MSPTSPVMSNANSVAQHFIKSTAERATPTIMKKTIMQAKTLLQSGYSTQEVKDVIDFLIDEKKVTLYSLGYVSACINDTLRQMQAIKIEEESKLLAKEVRAAFSTEQHRGEVVSDGESSNRNKSKANRFGLQSRFGEKSFSDMLEGE